MNTIVLSKTSMPKFCVLIFIYLFFLGDGDRKDDIPGYRVC